MSLVCPLYVLPYVSSMSSCTSTSRRARATIYACLTCLPYMSALYVCLICLPYMPASYVCLICLPYMSALYACRICLPHTSALYVCLICLPYMPALYVRHRVRGVQKERRRPVPRCPRLCQGSAGGVTKKEEKIKNKNKKERRRLVPRCSRLVVI